jgi:hypothetical protein
MVEKESLYIMGALLANKALLSFNDDDNLLSATNFLTLEYIFHDIDSRLNLFKEGEDDTNQVRFKFDLKMYAD